MSAQSEQAPAQDWTYLTWTLSDEGVSVHNDAGTWRGSGLALKASDARASGLLDMAWNATGVKHQDNHVLALHDPDGALVTGP